jgi:hydroxyisourate hydrolase
MTPMSHSGGPGDLTTHVLDLVRGGPAAGLAVELQRVYSDGSGEILAVARTNADGRTVEPLVEPGDLERGRFQLIFGIGDYLKRSSPGTVPFLDEVPVRFEITDPAAAHHVAMLFTPWSYQVYRGS